MLGVERDWDKWKSKWKRRENWTRMKEERIVSAQPPHEN